jgi:hypothetical protein
MVFAQAMAAAAVDEQSGFLGDGLDDETRAFARHNGIPRAELNAFQDWCAACVEAFLARGREVDGDAAALQTRNDTEPEFGFAFTHAALAGGVEGHESRWKRCVATDVGMVSWQHRGGDGETSPRVTDRPVRCGAGCAEMRAAECTASLYGVSAQRADEGAQRLGVGKVAHEEIGAMDGEFVVGRTAGGGCHGVRSDGAERTRCRAGCRR